MAVDLGKEIGPLPLGAWVAVVVGGVGIVWYTRTHSSADAGSDDDTNPTDVTGNPGVGTGAVGGWMSTTPPATDTPDAAITTNEQWSVAAINWLIGQGYSPTLSDSAIRKYINGAKLSVGEFTLVGIALTKFGSPPNPLPPGDGDPPVKNPPPGGGGVSTQPPGTKPPVIKPPTNTPKPHKPTPKPPVKKPTTPVKHYRYYTVEHGDNLWNISKKYYGTGTRYGSIYNANRKGKKRADGKVGMISKPSLILPGWVLLIP